MWDTYSLCNNRVGKHNTTARQHPTQRVVHHAKGYNTNTTTDVVNTHASQQWGGCFPSTMRRTALLVNIDWQQESFGARAEYVRDITCCNNPHPCNSEVHNQHMQQGWARSGAPKGASLGQPITEFVYHSETPCGRATQKKNTCGRSQGSLLLASKTSTHLAWARPGPRWDVHPPALLHRARRMRHMGVCWPLTRPLSPAAAALCMQEHGAHTAERAQLASKPGQQGSMPAE
jgi:hypothetical protein